MKGLANVLNGGKVNASESMVANFFLALLI